PSGRNVADRELAKAVEAVLGRDPDVSLAVLEESSASLAREPVASREAIRAAPVHVQQPAAQVGDPQRAIAIPEQRARLHAPKGARSLPCRRGGGGLPPRSRPATRRPHLPPWAATRGSDRAAPTASAARGSSATAGRFLPTRRGRSRPGREKRTRRHPRGTRS